MVETVIHIRDRKILNMADLKAIFSQLKDGKHLVTIKDIRKRSIQQNRYYWGVVVPMVRKALYEMGYDDVRTNDDAHMVMKSILLKVQIKSAKANAIITVAGSTKELSIPEFDDYIERVCRWAAEFLGIYIPSPNEQLAELEDWQESLNGNF